MLKIKSCCQFGMMSTSPILFTALTNEGDVLLYDVSQDIAYPRAQDRADGTMKLLLFTLDMLLTTGPGRTDSTSMPLLATSEERARDSTRLNAYRITHKSVAVSTELLSLRASYLGCSVHAQQGRGGLR